MTVCNLDALLTPKSVALVGASPRRGAIGHTVMTRLLGAGFTGAVHLVNPKYDAIDGRPCFASVADLAQAPDLGVTVTPPQIGLDASFAHMTAALMRMEVILGVSDDPTFGPVMAFGTGGVAVEVVADKALVLPQDAALYHDFFPRLTPHDRRLRFMSTINALSVKFGVNNIADRDYAYDES